MIETIGNYENAEKLMCLISDSQKFAKPNDKLTMLIEKYSGFINSELREDELECVTAAKMPDIPKYKKLK